MVVGTFFSLYFFFNVVRILVMWFGDVTERVKNVPLYVTRGYEVLFFITMR